MTDIEQKALALLGEVSPYKCEKVDHAHHAYLCAALRLSVEQHEAFRREVSDALHVWYDGTYPPVLDRFIIPAPKPDPLVEVLTEISGEGGFDNFDHYAHNLRAALEARGLEIKEKGH